MAEYGEGATEHAYDVVAADVATEGDRGGVDLLEWCARFVDDSPGWGRTGRQPNEWESAGGARLRLTWARGEVTATFLSRGWDSMATWQRALNTERFRMLDTTIDAVDGFAGLIGTYLGGSNPRVNTAWASRGPSANTSAVAFGKTPLPVAPFEHGVVYTDGHTAIDSGMLPTRAYATDAGLDLYTVGEWRVEPGAWVDIPCGIRMQLPDHVWGLITGRSSTLRKRGLLVPQSVIDPGYRGPLFVQCWNLGKEPVNVKDKERVGQLILVPNVTPTFDPAWVEAVEDSERGGSGFGSSGS